MHTTIPQPPAPPRPLHALCQQSARLVPCEHCGQKPGRACSDAWGQDGYHLLRFATAFRHGLLSGVEVDHVLGHVDVVTAGTIVRDGAR